MPSEPIGRMYLRKNAPGDGQRPKIRLWTLPTPKEGSTSEKLLRHYVRTFENVDRLDAKIKELGNDAGLTPIGRDRQALDFSFSQIMPDILRGRRTLAKAAVEVSNMRGKLKKPSTDPLDMAGALRRQEIRAVLRQMDHKTRDEFLKQNKHPEIQAAVIEQPAPLSGVVQMTHDRLMSEMTASINAELIAEIHELERAIEIAASVLEEGTSDIRAQAVAIDAGYSDVDRFEARAKEAAQLQDPPWLKIHNENGQEILRKFSWNEETRSGSWPIATSEEIELGIIADSKDQYDKLRVAAPCSALSGTGDEARRARADFVNEQGIDAYLNRTRAA